MNEKIYRTLDEWVTLLRDLGRKGAKIVTANDFRLLLGLGEESQRKAVSRLVRKRLLLKAGKGIYLNPFSLPSLEELAMILVRPSCISLASALEDHGILSQIPQVTTCVTTRKPAGFKTPIGEIVYRHLSPKYFWGYTSDGGILRAEPEKALLDFIYLGLKRGEPLDPDEFSLAQVNPNRFFQYAERFPRSVRKVGRKIFAGRILTPLFSPSS